MRLTIKLIKFLEDLTLLTLRIFPAEAAKNITLKLLKVIYSLNLISLFASSNIEKSKLKIKNLSLKNRIGIAGGLDKNAEYFHIFSSLGFGFVEVGTVTLEPQTGNPKPRIFRFTKDKTLINSLGFNNLGSVQVLKNIKKLSLKNRIGIAGGLDKNAEYFHIFSSLGFGFVEIGTVTLEPQIGNPKPRIFRFVKDKTLVNSLGFNNAGSVQVLKNIKKYKSKFDGILGISIGKSKNTKTKNAWQDYLHLMDYFYLEADYLAINISSPNTKNLRELSSQENLEFLLKKISQKKFN